MVSQFSVNKSTIVFKIVLFKLIKKLSKIKKKLSNICGSSLDNFCGPTLSNVFGSILDYGLWVNFRVTVVDHFLSNSYGPIFE